MSESTETRVTPAGVASLAVVVAFLWAAGTAVGMGIVWAFWDMTRCRPVEGSLANDCTGGPKFGYWDAWPVLALWSLLVLGLLLFFVFRPRADAGER